METQAEKWFKDWCERDKLKILATNPTLEDVIRDSQIYRIRDAVSQACRRAGGVARGENYKPRDAYLSFAISEIEKSGQRPTLKRLMRWVELDNPQIDLSETACKKAISTYRKKPAC